jgi:tRNA C32,U32 (ribose-2'-O)-methylase TrmJ
MVIVRAKYRRLQAALSRWRARHGRQFIQSFQRFTDLADKLAGFTLSNSSARRRRLRINVFEAWAKYSRRMAPISRDR